MSEKKLSHIGALDGLRGIAVLLVLVFHFSWGFAEHSSLLAAVKHTLWSGWMGVDMFFVLSGYLITRGLVKDSEFSIGKRLKLFWARRAFRIFPLYYIVLIVGSIVCLALGQSQHIPGAGYWLYFQNYTLAFDPMPLRWTAHFWSLAIEEQFYFVWPLFVLLVAKAWRPRLALLLLVSSGIARAALLIMLPKVLHWDQEQTAKLVYRATPTHMDGLLVGALLAMLEREPSHPWNVLVQKLARPAFFTGLLALVGMMVWTRGFGTYDRRVMIVGYPLLAVVFGAAVVIGAHGRFSARAQRILSTGFLASVGKVSYGMYIFHWFFIALLVERQETWVAAHPDVLGTVASVGVIVVGIALTYVLAQLSYRVVETPFLKLKERFHD
jgi:peptidoglycan/LPS O-acetylase OafA/YrhL